MARQIKRCQCRQKSLIGVIRISIHEEDLLIAIPGSDSWFLGMLAANLLAVSVH